MAPLLNPLPNVPVHNDGTISLPYVIDLESPVGHHFQSIVVNHPHPTAATWQQIFDGLAAHTDQPALAIIWANGNYQIKFGAEALQMQQQSAVVLQALGYDTVVVPNVPPP